MAHAVTTNPMQNYLFQRSESSIEKPKFSIDGSEIQENGCTGTVKPQQLERYWMRTLALILIPPITTGWYGVIWIRLLSGIENDDAVKYRTFSGSIIYYSWFIIGIFGLAWAQFGLLGVELAMLQTPFWKAPNLVATLMHADATWSNPSGWGKAVYHREFYRLWSLLTLLSVLPFVAFPLSGLVFEIGDGYIKTSEHPIMTGRNPTTYNNVAISPLRTPDAWKMGLTPTIPGFGVIYTPPGLDRSKHSCLKRVPNTLPLTESIPDMFLAPQADVPVSGKAWGLRVKYECSIIRKASELTVLSEKPLSRFSKLFRASGETTYPGAILQTPSGSSIQAFNSSSDPGSMNLWSYSEIGLSVPTDTSATYGNGSYSDTVDISDSMVMEYVLWQLQFHSFYDKPNETLPFDSTLGPTIEGMGSPYFLLENKTLVSNETFFKIGQGKNFTVPRTNNGLYTTLNSSTTDLRDFFDPTQIIDYEFRQFTEAIIEVAAPIGVRCVVYSVPGTATLDGVTSTFSNFSRVNPEPQVQGQPGGVLGNMAQQILFGTRFDDFYQPSHLTGLTKFYGNMGRYLRYIPSPALLQSVLLAYGVDALERMYGLTLGAGPEWENTDLTSSDKGKILTIATLIPGRWAGYLVLGLFCLWSVLSVVLGLVYGFRKRPSDRLDGYSMFKLGVDMADDLRHNDQFMNEESLYGNKTLQALPGRLLDR
ncbi:hypothetical protein V502_10534 [Pseudogymnoascus sp. VKM F-4520 (FW-2644)]|nr:hypothetical protein V502_10534 [Pseudogymnoascus sp. VKM F-4520 (FW-2644)]